MIGLSLPRSLLLSLFALALCIRASAAPSADDLKFFEAKVRPILVESCQQCHAEKKHKGDLRLDNLPYILHGGATGPAIVPHKPDESLLVKAIGYKDPDLQMPPDDPLPADQIAILKQWIAIGAPWPEAEVAAAKHVHRPGEITAEDRAWWAFQPVKSPPVPKLQTTPQSSGSASGSLLPAPRSLPNPIDAFVLTKLKENGLAPAPEADRLELIRRLTFDLHGLPPDPEEVNAFLLDRSPNAYERLVDRLLASPRYGERWAQHWLDLVRYAESDGYRLDSYRPNVWPYRDYVVSSFNEDKPYNQFVREQIAGDEIAPNDPKVTIGTAFLRHSIYEYNQRDSEGQWRGILNEVTDVTADVFLGMSVQCAHCHDHKFDPILQKDYYRLQSFFANITWPEDKVLATDEEKASHDEQMRLWQEAAKGPLGVIDSIIEPHIAKLQTAAMVKFPEEVQAMWRKPRELRTPYEEQIVELAWRQAEYERVKYKTTKLKDPHAAQLKEAEAHLAEFDSLKPKPLVTAFVIGETGPESSDASYITRRSGKIETKPGFLTILQPEDAVIPEPPPGAATSGRRTVLANWLARPENPLTTRVIVNRIWQYHFGRGLVATPSDFGRLGEPPSHPELLDYLTSAFLKGGWKMKALHKMILMSATYRQTARRAPNQKELTTDPENRLLWRFNPTRLDAEQARDAVLCVSGEMDFTMAGEGVEPAKPRRTIYTRKIRNTQDDFLQSLDAPPGFASVPTRDATTTATQSLLMINGDWPLERARAMAARLLQDQPKEDAQIIGQAYALAFSRPPTRNESTDALAFLESQRALLDKEIPNPHAESSPLADASEFFGADSLSRTTKTLWLQPGSKNEKLRVIPAAATQGAPAKIEGNNFTVEAVAYLDNLYPDGAVRTIASRWNNNKSERGWALGVTSEKSAYKPNNLIVQFCGDDFQGSLIYEVVPSNLRVSLKKPFYIAAVISNTPATPEQKFGGSVTFYLRDLSEPGAPMQTATIPTQVCGGYVNSERALYIGGRDQDKRSLWHGAIARIAIRQGSLDPAQLMAWAPADDATCLTNINADALTELTAAPAPQLRWESSAPAHKGQSPVDPQREAVTDFCHILLNSNEFFYLH